MHRWRQRKLQNIYLNVKMLQCDVSVQENNKKKDLFSSSVIVADYFGRVTDQIMAICLLL